MKLWTIKKIIKKSTKNIKDAFKFLNFYQKILIIWKKTDFLIYLNILYIFDQNFTLVPTIKTIRIFLIKNWETWKRLLCFWSIFWLFFLSSKVSKWNLIKNLWYTKILHCTTLILIKKLEFCDFFLRKFLLTVFRIFH